MAGLSDAKLLERLRSGPDPDAAEALFLRHADAVYGLCLRILGEEHLAEDAAQEAYLKILNRAESFRPGGPSGSSGEARAWVLGVAAHAALDLLRRERRRARRERARAGARLARGSEKPDAQAESAELARAASLAVDALEMDLRVPVLLCCVEGLRHEDAARVLGVSRRAVGLRVERGLEKLRRRLAGAGLALAPGALALGLSMAPAPVAPPGLVASVPKLTAAGSKAAAAGTSVILKGGIAMKLVAGVVLAGAVAAGVAVVGGGPPGGGGGGELPAEKPKFSVPIWHPDVQWSTEKKCIGGSGLLGHLQGPRREIMRYWGSGFSRLFGPDAGNQPAIYSHDPKIERVHVVAGGAAGYLDGPFSRARFGGWSYGSRSTGARSPDGRFVYFTEPYYGKVLRRLDLKEQRASTVSLPKGTVINMAPDDEGNLYTLMVGGTLLIMDTGQGKVIRTLKLDPGSEQISYALSWSTALDTVNNRLYATRFKAKKYYIWYWDLKDGSFHGVLAIPKEGESVRPKPSGGGIGGCLPGPFKGTKLYNEGSVYFGPDDPTRRFLYTSRVDTSTFFRLDLDKKEIWVFATDKEKKVFRFIGPGETGAVGTGVRGLKVLPDGGLMSTCPHWTGAHVFTNRRLK